MDDKLYKAWWYALAYGMGAMKRMQMMDRMRNAMTNHEIAELIYYRVCGTPDDVMTVIDQMIEEHEIGIDQFRQNEMEILGLVDDRMFCCEVCGWNYEVSEMSWQDMICNHCIDEETDDES